MLYLLTDNGIHTVAYVMQNGLFPNKYALETESIKEVSPFFNDDDEVIVITQGLVNWTWLRLSRLINALETSNIKGYKVYSTMDLPGGVKYTKVEGDLFYGTYTDFDGKKWGKPYPANIADVFQGYSKEIEPMCFDIEDEDTTPLNVPIGEPMHLIAVDVLSLRKGGSE